MPSHLWRLGCVFLLALAASACHSSPALEELRAGSNLKIKLRDGRYVAGRLLSVDPDTVVVSAPRTDGRIWVTRASIADVQSGAEAANRHTLREVTLPTGAVLELQLDTRLASEVSMVGDLVQGRLTSALLADGVVIAPTGTTVIGTVLAARESGMSGEAALAIHFDRLLTDSVTYHIRTMPLRWPAEAIQQEDQSALLLVTAGGEIQLEPGMPLHVRLVEALQILTTEDSERSLDLASALISRGTQSAVNRVSTPLECCP